MLSPTVIGWLVGAVGFVASFVVRELWYLPWMLAIHITGEGGRPTNANLLLALLFLVVQWAAIGYAVARAMSRQKTGPTKGEKG